MLRPTGFVRALVSLNKVNTIHLLMKQCAVGGHWGKSFVGIHFWFTRDCKLVQEILKYSGIIAMFCRWAQEHFGYHFTILHHGTCIMMIDVDFLTRQFVRNIDIYSILVAMLHKVIILTH